MAETFEIAGQVLQPGETRRLEIPVARLVTQTQLSVPVAVLHGTRPGPKLWLSAALHGDELNGTEIIRRVLARVKVERLRGTVVAVPVVNVFGFLEQSRYLPDRRDLNRSFPGSNKGSLASRLAYLFMKEIVARCEVGIDLHTGSHHRVNLPQIRADLDDKETRRLSKAFGAPLMIHARKVPGSLRDAATERGRVVLVYEAGEPLRFNRRSILVGVRGVKHAMQALGMLAKPKRAQAYPTVEVRKTHWLRANRSGIVQMKVGLRDHVEKGQTVAVLYDAFGDVVSRVRAGAPGVVIGHTLNPLLNRGEAILHVGELPAARKRG